MRVRFLYACSEIRRLRQMMKLHNFQSVLLAMTVLTATMLFAQNSVQLGKSPIKDVIAAMTVEEKVGLVLGMGRNFQGFGANTGPIVGETNERVKGAAGLTMAIPRLGIPAMVLADGPAGLRIQPYRNADSTKSYYCTAFPIATLLASSWDIKLVEQVGVAVGEELKEYGVDILLAPALNIHRNPLGGRNFEYYSEDPLITGKMAAAMVKGIQSLGVGTSLKHFVANNHEWNRGVINVHASQRALREIYLRGFEIAVRESSPWTIMSSYNKINGTYTSESKDLLTHILRDDWGFNGLVMTDWHGGRDAVAQMVAGNDLLMPGVARQYETLLKAIHEGTLSKEILDRNIANILNVILKSPTYKKYQYSDQPDLKAHAVLCRKAASEGMVLLKNDNNVLPLTPGLKVAAFGNTSYDMVTGGSGSGNVNEAYSISLLQGLEGAGFEVDPTLAKIYQKYIAEQKAIQPETPWWLMPEPITERSVPKEEILEMVDKTDLALITIGRNSGEFKDRELEDDFNLSASEEALIKDVTEIYHIKGKQVVIILNIGGVMETISWRDLPNAILLAWQPGQESGNAIVDVLCGKINPSGKLATTFPKNYEDVLSSSNFPGVVVQGPDPNRSFRRGARAAEVIYKDDIFVGYRHLNSLDSKPAYEFGYGLSYTEFKYSKLKLNSKKFKDELIATIRVTNTGEVAGKEIVQFYVCAPEGRLKKPVMELKGFEKTSLLQPGESVIISVSLKAKDLASFDTKSSAWIVEAGEYMLCAGASSLKTAHKKSFKVKNDIVVEHVSKSLAPDIEINE